MRKFWGAAALCLLAAPAWSLDYSPLLQLQAEAGHENQFAGAQDHFAWDGQAIFLPGLGFGDRGSFLPLFAYLRDDRDVVVEEDSVSVERNTFLFRPLYQYDLGRGLDLKLWGAGRRAVTLESYGQAWSEGVYDYEEYGGGAGLGYHGQGRIAKAELGVEVAHRGYPNWHELGTQVIGGANYYDKDYLGTKVTAGLAGPGGPGWGWRSDLTYLLRSYTDALVEEVNGYVPGSARQDHFAFSETHVTWNRGAWLLDLDLELTLNLSNENYIDGPAAQYMQGFYDFESEQWGPSLTYAPQGPTGPSLSLGLSFLNRTYDSPGGGGRLIRQPNGTYAAGTEADTEQHYSVSGSYPLAWGLALVADADYTLVQSNQTSIGTYVPAYDLFRATAGLRYRL